MNTKHARVRFTGQGRNGTNCSICSAVEDNLSGMELEIVTMIGMCQRNLEALER